jgi:diadenosine tetraphosphate (Ap4A) HIT family hydrolase
MHRILSFMSVLQSVFLCHVHLLQRRKGDVENPKGGVRHVIPYKGNYEDLR